MSNLRLLDSACRFFPCTVEYFLERSQLLRVAKGWRRRVLEVLVDFGMLDGETLARQQAEFNCQTSRQDKGPGQFLQLKLDPAGRIGQPENVNKVMSDSFLLYRQRTATQFASDVLHAV